MTRGTRIALLAVAAVILVGGIVLASSGGDDSDDDGGTATQTQAAGTRTETDATGGTEAPATQEQETVEVRVDVIRIRDGKPVGGARTIEYRSGDTVRLRLTANTEQTIHIHGYDREATVPAGGAATVRFKADAEGIFEIESHDTGTLLAKLEVRP